MSQGAEVGKPSFFHKVCPHRRNTGGRSDPNVRLRLRSIPLGAHSAMVVEKRDGGGVMGTALTDIGH